ncbi:hypothetical protein P7K49_023712 [Saguinus oedipus]|uniref:Growth/differentiation factor 10 n=1 Tax=Saguinus oedipus TaxID=9490 RepID=A0ABQ9UMF5_SAGOE|nr:hypothetical protein P7K49_023712 [Saguinus oedipus]
MQAQNPAGLQLASHALSLSPWFAASPPSRTPARTLQRQVSLPCSPPTTPRKRASSSATLHRKISVWLVMLRSGQPGWVVLSEIVRPSNHATIQSIVRAVGIVPGIPEPCCVPDKMNSLGVLFLDENRNVVLKVYPNMSVDTCACR